MKRLSVFSSVLLIILLSACSPAPVADSPVSQLNPATATAEEVAGYLEAYDQLPAYYMTKDEARIIGWDARAGNLWEVAPGFAIGGDPFYNREGLLPKDVYFEADLAYEGGHRGPERLVYAEGGPYFTTEDHYESFRPVIPKEKP